MSRPLPPPIEIVPNISIESVQTPKKKKKKKKVPVPAEKNIFDAIGKSPKDFNGCSLLLHIQKTDALISHANLRHPMVRIHVIDTSLDCPLKKKKPHAVTFSREPETLDYILPVLTKPFELNGGRTAFWNEKIVLEEDYLYLVQPHVLLVFEIIDFVSPKFMQKDGWQRIAWAFFKLVGSHEKVNTEQDVRLQLYTYPWTWRKPHDLFAYELFKTEKLKKYPSTLYINVSATKSSSPHYVTHRPNQPSEIETGQLTYDQLCQLVSKSEATKSVMHLVHQWRRNAGQFCKLPNRLMYRIDPGISGSFFCSFSNNGNYLSLSCIHLKTYPIRIYNVLDGERVMQLDGHLDLVYQITWRSDDQEIVSVSSDGSARVWNANTGQLDHILQHPSYVYTGQYHPKSTHSDKLIATSCYDRHVYLWRIQKNQPNLCKLAGHDGAVNSAIFDLDGTKLYSGDVTGVFKVWSSEKEYEYECVKSVDIHQPIRHLQLHPTNRKVLIQTNDHIHCLDTRIYRTITHISVKNGSHYCTSTFSPCGSFILMGLEQGTLNVWNADTGLPVAYYNKNIKKWLAGPIVHVAFHPKDHIFAMSCWGHYPAQVWTWDKTIDDINLKTLAVVEKQAHFDVDKIVAKSMASRLDLTGTDSPKKRTLRRSLDLYDGSVKAVATI